MTILPRPIDHEREVLVSDANTETARIFAWAGWSCATTLQGDEKRIENAQSPSFKRRVKERRVKNRAVTRRVVFLPSDIVLLQKPSDDPMGLCKGLGDSDSSN
ncbi:hypothetical protein X765_20660 [Mesorhizobium sp. LSHC440B00]|nr:hypothetical protein X765_20660 [Mesorhizobium sp. LSHC440B00]ESX37796.1 hypothetical protein X763_13615 [Mesorhizobium sp. LSHC432A00]